MEASDRDGDEDWSAAEAEAALCAQVKSGESVVAFAARHGVTASRLYGWRYQLAGARGEKREAEHGRLIPMTVIGGEPIDAPRSSGGGVVVIEGSLRVEVEQAETVSPGWIATLLRSVREGARSYFRGP